MNLQVDNFMIFYLVLAIALLSLVLTGFVASWNERNTSKRKGR